MIVLSLSNISKSFGPTAALDDVNLQLRSGEVHALIGENGAGKSTLMNVLAGLIQPDRGAMEVERCPYAPADPHEARAKGIALIHQELSLFPQLTVAENIMMGMEPSRWALLDRRALREQTAAVLSTFHHPEIRPETRVKDLSIAARQIVEICRAIAARARIILMDEPTSSLQRDDVERLFKLIRKFRDQQIAVIYISHFLEEVREIAGAFTVLRDGHVVASGEIKSISDEELISCMVGRPVANLFPRRSSQPVQQEEPILEVRDLATPPTLKNVSFELRRGEILGIAGLMGSGRTRAVRTIFGLDQAKAGTIKLKGQSFAAGGCAPAGQLLQGIGYLSEDRKGEGLAVTLSIADNVTMTRFASCSSLGWLNLSRQRRQAERMGGMLAVKARSVDQRVSALSGGNQQKVALARLLHQEADVLLLDEPARGIDIGSKAQVYEIISQCANDGKAILMVSSYLPELFGMCDRLAVMSRGRLSPAKPIYSWTPESVLQTAIGGGLSS